MSNKRSLNNNLRNALILTEGGKKFGFGHLTRSLAFVQGLQQHRTVKNPKISFVVNGDQMAQKFLRKQGIRPILLDWVRYREKISESIKTADLILIDSYQAPAALYSFIARLNPQAVVLAIDDFKRIDYDADLVINPSVYGDQIHYPKNVYGKGRPQYALGKDYIIIRREFWPREKKIIHREIKNILITLGGMEHGRLMERISRFISKNYPSFKLHVVTAQNNLKFKTQNVKFYSNLSAIAIKKLFGQTDLCISGSGQTLYELVRCGTPTLGICLADNQQWNAKYFYRYGFIEYLGRAQDQRLFTHLKRGIQKMTSPILRKRKSFLGQQLVDGRGVERILAISNQLQKEKAMILRPARWEDCRDVWRWRNHSQVRKEAFQSRLISYADHQKWFKRVMKSEHVRLYIAENLKKEKIGQARFDMDCRGVSFISTNLNPKFFGRRLGGRLIKAATENFLKENPQNKDVLAEIKRKNIISQKAFAKADYQFFKRGHKNGQPITTYIFRGDHGRN